MVFAIFLRFFVFYPLFYPKFDNFQPKKTSNKEARCSLLEVTEMGERTPKNNRCCGGLHGLDDDAAVV